MYGYSSPCPLAYGQEFDLFYKNVCHKKYCCIYSPQGDTTKL